MSPLEVIEHGMLCGDDIAAIDPSCVLEPLDDRQDGCVSASAVGTASGSSPASLSDGTSWSVSTPGSVSGSASTPTNASQSNDLKLPKKCRVDVPEIEQHSMVMDPGKSIPKTRFIPSNL